jgi:hypothetical protein
MAEPSPEATARADLIVAAWLANQPRGVQPRAIADLILAIAEALDDLAGPLAALLEGVRNGETGEMLQPRANMASSALWRHRGQPPGRLP